MEGKRIVRAGIGYTVGNYLIKGLAFLTLPIFARIMSTEDFGVYNIFVAYEGIFLYLIGFGFETSFKSARYRYGLRAEAKDDKYCYEEYVSTSVSIVFVNAAVWLLLAVIFRKQAMALLDLDFPSIIMLVFFSLSNAVILCYNSDASLSYNYKGYVRIGLINAVGSISISIALILWVFAEKSYLGRMLGATSVITVLAVFVWFMFIRRQRPGNLKEYAGWGLKYSLPIVPHGISQILLASFDRIMIGRMVGEGPSGIYSFAYNLFAIIYVTYRSLDPVWSTWFFEKMNSGKHDDIKRYSGLYMLLMMVLSALVILLSPELILILGSAKYAEAVYCVIPIVAGGYFTFLYSLPCQVEYFREKTKVIAGATMCAAAMNIILNLIFIRKYGYVAAAYTTLVTYMFYFLFHFLIARRIEGKNLFPGTTIILCSASVIIISLVALLLINNRILRIAIAFVVFISVFGYLWKNNKEAIRTFIGKRAN